jgi:hypothetical protein
MPRRQIRQFPFKLVHVGALPEDLYGVYMFSFRKRCLYIGQAKAQPLKSRLNQHFKVSHNERLNDWILAYGPELIVCCLELPKLRIDRAERRMIKARKPVANIIHNPNVVKV